MYLQNTVVQLIAVITQLKVYPVYDLPSLILGLQCTIELQVRAWEDL